MERGNIMTTKKIRVLTASEEEREYSALCLHPKARFHEKKVLGYCVDKKTHKLMELAEQGNWHAQSYVCYGYVHGDFGFEKDFNKVVQFAKKGWLPAVEKLLGIYSLGLYGQKPSRRKYLNLVNKFIFIPRVCDRYCYDLKYGSPAIPKNHEALKILAERNDRMGDYAKLYLGYPTSDEIFLFGEECNSEENNQ